MAFVTLRNFSSSELIFDEAETKLILGFFFKNKANVVNKIVVTDKVRGFAQGLLIEAIDASYAMGFVEIIFRSTANPRTGVKKILKKVAKKAAKHWFKHATEKNLLNAEIYEIVRSRLALNFGNYLVLLSNGLAKKTTTFTATVAYA